MLKNRNLIIAIVAVAVILIAGAGYVLVSNDDNKTDTQDSSANQQSASNGTTKGSLTSLTSSKKAQECTMNYSSESGSGTGTIYTDGNGRGRMHLDITTEKGIAVQTDQIMKEGKAYSWTTNEGQTYGVVADISAASQQTQSQSQDTTNTPKPDQDFDIKCKDWNVDEAKFTNPANVNFIDLNNFKSSLPTSR